MGHPANHSRFFRWPGSSLVVAYMERPQVALLGDIAMRTFPKSLATFRQIVKKRGEQLRSIPFEELKHQTDQPEEHITVESRQAKISVIVQPCQDGTVRVVVQGFMEPRLLPGKHVAIDGFYKHPDGTVTPMSSGELYDYD